MSQSFRCALAPFRVDGTGAPGVPAQVFHTPLAVPGARVFGYLVGGEPQELARIQGVIHEAATALKPKQDENLESFASQFFKQINRTVRNLPLKSLAMKQPPATTALIAITLGQHLALAGRRSLAFRIAGTQSEPSPIDLFGPETSADYRSLFTTMVFGGLGRRETLLLAGRSVLDYCAPAHLAKLMNTASAEAAREALLGVLQDLQPGTPLAGVVIKVVPADPIAAPTGNPTDSLNSLLRQARETQALLTPMILPGLAAPLRSLWTALRGRRGTLSRQLSFHPAHARSLVAGLRDAAAEIATLAVTVPARAIAIVKTFRAMPRRIQAATVMIAATALIFVVSIIALLINRSQAKDRAFLEERLNTLTGERAAIEASMLYGDETAAWNHLAAARAVFDAIPTKRRFRAARADAAAELDADLRRLRHEVVVDTPGTADPAVFADVLSPTQATYNGRTYRLDAASGQIFKNDEPWLKSPAPELSDAISIAVDSAIYLGTTSGQVLKFLKGNPVALSVSPTDPPLNAITRIRAPEGSSFLYLLIPSTKRVVVLDRNRASVTAQYTSSAFDALIDFVVDEPNRILSVKTANGTFRVPLAHLK